MNKLRSVPASHPAPLPTVRAAPSGRSPTAARLAYYSTPDPLSGCHIWHGPSVNGGYGLIRYGGQH
jgi:hypothetical protein